MRSLIEAGARQIISNQDRGREPGENPDLERRRHPANDDVHRQTRDGEELPKRRGAIKSAVTRSRQRILLRRRMHKCVDITPYRREKLTVPSHVFAEQTRP